MTPNAYNVALLIETARAFGRGVVRGVADYSRAHGPWRFHIQPGDLLQRFPSARQWQGQGIIARIETPALARRIVASGLPTVIIARRCGPSTPCVVTDQSLICQLALDHLLERGFRHLAFYGITDWWSGQRQKLFTSQAQAHGLTCHVHVGSPNRENRRQQRQLARWLRELPKPLGLLACDDLRAREVIDRCLEVGVPVPEEVSVLGIDNDEFICDLAYPSLSSVALNTQRIGYEAAGLLDQMMRGRSVPPTVQVPPLGVITRQSTDLLAIEDADVARAVRFIREHFSEKITVQDVLQEVPCSRRSLEQRFRRTLRRSPHDEIRRVRLERVKELLSLTDVKIEKIAQVTGFSSLNYFYAQFHQHVGITPAAYRKNTCARR